MYKPEKLPIPKTAVPNGGRPSKYPFRAMSVGESFLIPLEDQRENAANSIRIYCHRMSKQLGKIFTRVVLDDRTIQVIRHK